MGRHGAGDRVTWGVACTMSIPHDLISGGHQETASFHLWTRRVASGDAASRTTPPPRIGGDLPKLPGRRGHPNRGGTASRV